MNPTRKEKAEKFIYFKYPHLKNPLEGKNPIVDIEFYKLIEWLLLFSGDENEAHNEMAIESRSTWEARLYNERQLSKELCEALKLSMNTDIFFENWHHQAKQAIEKYEKLNT